MRFINNIERQLLSNDIDIVLPSNKNIEDFCLNIHAIYIDSRLILDKNKILAKEIAWFLKDIDNTTKYINKYFILNCKYNDESILLKIGYKLYEIILKNYNKNISNKLEIKSKKIDQFTGYDNSKLVRNYDWCEYISNDDINILYDKYIRNNVLNIEDKRCKDILNNYLKQYNISYNYFYNKIRSKKLNVILND
jgi:hypothetical protein